MLERGAVWDYRYDAMLELGSTAITRVRICRYDAMLELGSTA
jgi:hypothetical protein